MKKFGLQQYFRKFGDFGYGSVKGREQHDILRLTLLNKKQRKDLIQSLKPLPGHRERLNSMFSMLDENLVLENMPQIMKKSSTSKKPRQSSQSNAQSGSIKEVKNERHKSHVYTRSVTHDAYRIENSSYIAGANLQTKNESEPNARISGIVNKKYQNSRMNVKSLK